MIHAHSLTPSEDYSSFLTRKLQVSRPQGIDVSLDQIHARPFPFQRDIIRWGLRRGKAAIFANRGLGKTCMQLAWCEQVIAYTDRPCLILTPLAVAAQTVREAHLMGLRAAYCKDMAGALVALEAGIRIIVTNYDRLHLFDASAFIGVVADESSIIKNANSATRKLLQEAFQNTPFKLPCTATPSPNDYTELGTHAEFLGVLTKAEMLATYFTHDGGSTQDWKLKRHATEAFWRWVSSWAVMINKPSDLGYDDAGYDLPPLNIKHHVVNLDVMATRARQVEDHKKGKRKSAQIGLFVDNASTFNDKRWARRESIGARVKLAAEIIAKEPHEPWIVWVHLNDEGDEAERELKAIVPGLVQIAGKDTPEFKEQAMLGFCTGNPLSLITKGKIAGFGMNWQHCARVINLGVSDSFEEWYQEIGRVHRFGQTREVDCHIITSEADGDILANLKRKQADADEMTARMVKYVSGIRDDTGATIRTGAEYNAKQAVRLPEWTI